MFPRKYSKAVTDTQREDLSGDIRLSAGDCLPLTLSSAVTTSAHHPCLVYRQTATSDIDEKQQ